MCGDCQRRAETNPLRVLDCKVEADQPIIEKLPSIVDCLCDACRAHFEAVKQSLADRGLAYQCVRVWCGPGLHMRTTFEVVHGSLGAEFVLAAGATTVWPKRWLEGTLAGHRFSIGEDRL